MFMLIRPLAQERRAKVKVFRLGLCCNQRFFPCRSFGWFCGVHAKKNVKAKQESWLLTPCLTQQITTIEDQFSMSIGTKRSCWRMSTSTFLRLANPALKPPDDSCLVDAACSSWGNQPGSTTKHRTEGTAVAWHPWIESRWVMAVIGRLGSQTIKDVWNLWGHVLFPTTHVLGYMTSAISSHHEQNLKPIAWRPSRCKIYTVSEVSATSEGSILMISPRLKSCCVIHHIIPWTSPRYKLKSLEVF